MCTVHVCSSRFAPRGLFLSAAPIEALPACVRSAERPDPTLLARPCFPQRDPRQLILPQPSGISRVRVQKRVFESTHTDPCTTTSHREGQNKSQSIDSPTAPGEVPRDSYLLPHANLCAWRSKRLPAERLILQRHQSRHSFPDLCCLTRASIRHRRLLGAGFPRPLRYLVLVDASHVAIVLSILPT